MYNGRSHSLVDAATGSAWAAVTAAANGIITRGVLLDIARVRDVPWLEPGDGVFPEDLKEAERRQGVQVRSGDAVLLRHSYGRARHESGAAGGFTQAGWHASACRGCTNGEVALIGADTPQDVQPSGYEDVLMPVHAVSLVAMGLWLLDNCDLEMCATTAVHNYGLNYGDVDKGHRANGFTTDGGFCEYQVNNINTLVAIPDAMSDEEATLVVTAGTAMYGLTELGGLVAGESVVVTGPGPSASSGVAVARRSAHSR